MCSPLTPGPFPFLSSSLYLGPSDSVSKPPLGAGSVHDEKHSTTERSCVFTQTQETQETDDPGDDPILVLSEEFSVPDWNPVGPESPRLGRDSFPERGLFTSQTR